MWVLLFLLFISLGFTLASIPIAMGIDCIFHTTITEIVVGVGVISFGAVLGLLILVLAVKFIIAIIRDK